MASMAVTLAAKNPMYFSHESMSMTIGKFAKTRDSSIWTCSTRRRRLETSIRMERWREEMFRWKRS